MKKVGSVVLVALMVLGLSITAFADDTKFTVTTNVTEAKRGDTVTLTVAGAGFTAKANSMAIKLTAVDDKALVLDGKGEWKDASAPLKDGFDDDKGMAVIANTGALELVGDVFSFNVKVKDDAPIGTAEVKLDVIVEAADGTKTTYQTVGTVTVACTHTYGEWKSVDAENHEHVCTVCGAKESAPHAWDEGKVTVEATATTAGEKVFTCKDCGATKSEVIPPNPVMGDSAVAIVFLSTLALAAVCGVVVASKKRVNG